TRHKVVNVTGGLILAPGSQRISNDAQQAGFGTPGKTKEGHRLARLRGKAECFSDAREYVALSNTAGIAFINGARSALSFASYCCSSRSKVRSAARTTSLAF